jgi:gliding motility-associated lipoprotein GldD
MFFSHEKAILVRKCSLSLRIDELVLLNNYFTTIMRFSRFVSIVLVIFGLLVAGCKPDYSPKPRAYYRIDLPDKEYQVISDTFPYRFEYPVYGSLNRYKGKWKDSDTADYWINIEFPKFRSRVHLTFKLINNNLSALVEDAHSYAYKHNVKADAIIQSEHSNFENRVFSVLFDIKGNTASSLQFYATDSVRNFLRGALYFDCEPNKDSLAPVREFLRTDIVRMIESLTWRKLPK